MAAATTEDVVDIPAEGKAEVEKKDAPKGEKKGKREPKERGPVVKPEVIVKKPNQEAHEAAVKEIKDKISALQQQQKELRGALENKDGESKIIRTEADAVYDELKQARRKSTGLIAERNALYEQLNSLDKTRDDQQKQSKKLAQELKYKTVEEIEEAVKRLEYEMQVSSLSLNEEKKLMQEIAQLTSSKKMVGEYAKRQELSAKVKVDKAAIQEKLRAKNKEITEAKKIEEVKKAAVADLKAKGKNPSNDRKSLYKELDATKKEVSGLYDQLKKVGDEYYSALREWQKYDREMQRWKQEQRRLKAAELRELRKAEMAEREKEEAELTPWEIELDACEAIICYLTSLLPKEKKEEEKKDEEEEFDLFSGMAPKKQKRKRNKAKNEQIAVSAESFKHFDQVKLRPPLALADVPKALEEAKAKKEYYKTLPPPQKKKKEESEEKKEKAEDKEESTEAPKEEAEADAE